ncbi:MAG: hypothetical protein EOP33_09945 [Rickettsiaceae bacterium]|nr:MAG: hypothetical protein EOP33_09945 [Rickettsiaceae bacterium]
MPKPLGELLEGVPVKAMPRIFVEEAPKAVLESVQQDEQMPQVAPPDKVSDRTASPEAELPKTAVVEKDEGINTHPSITASREPSIASFRTAMDLASRASSRVRTPEAPRVRPSILLQAEAQDEFRLHALRVMQDLDLHARGLVTSLNAQNTQLTRLQGSAQDVLQLLQQDVQGLRNAAERLSTAMDDIVQSVDRIGNRLNTLVQESMVPSANETEGALASAYLVQEGIAQFRNQYGPQP